MYRLLFFLLFIFCNCIEPAFQSKEKTLSSLKECNLSLKTDFDSFVIKPTYGTHGGKGVFKESSQWTLKKCEEKYGKCMRQGYDNGPIECRIVKNGSYGWSKTVAWIVPSIEPPAFYTEFPWEHSLKKCIEEKYEHTPFLAMDIRTDGKTFSVLEINGAFGLPLEWVIDYPIVKNFIVWYFQRLHGGIYSLINRFVQVLCLLCTSFMYRKLEGSMWF